jgi:hypothetical protein
MNKLFVLLLFCSACCCTLTVKAQDLKTTVGKNKELDSLRKREEASGDSVVFNSKYIRYTTYRLTRDSIQTIPIDTGLNNIQNFSLIVQPRKPMVSTGLLGLPASSLLFDPAKTIGFNTGFHSLELYALDHDDVKFYRARTPFTSLYYVSGGDKEQILKITHTQNIKKNWNIGASFNRIGSNGDYTHQRGDHLNGVFFTWYQSTNKRYNLWLDGVFNTLKANENGSIVKNDIFEPTGKTLVDKKAEPVRLNTAQQLWRKNAIKLKQSYFVGRIDSTGNVTAQNILPTNKITHTLTYNDNSYSFRKDEIDSYKVLPYGSIDASVDSVYTNDSTNVKHLQNEFIYSFFLRAKGSSIIKNELKIDAGIRHDVYNYQQTGKYRDNSDFYAYTSSFQNLTLLGSLGYRFSNRADLNIDVQQIFQGRQAGDFLYEAKSNVLLSNAAGRVVLSAYLQNKSPEEIYSRYYGNHYHWNLGGDLERTKTVNFSFNYLNDRYKIEASANYYLISNYLYFVKDVARPSGIIPAQATADISLIKVSLGKKFSYKSYHLDAFVVYQKNDNSSVLRTPDVYTFNSIYKEQTLFKTLKTQIGFDVRYNTTYLAQSYSPAASQFYNGDDIKLGSKPVVDVWIKAGLRRANLFLKYDYANQGLFNDGFYTVNRYPMPDRLLKFGVSWNFYD